MLDSLKLPIKTSEPLASLSLGEVQKAFDRVLTASENIRSSCIGVRFGDFEWGGPMLVQFVLGIRLSQAQLMGILGAASDLHLEMEPLEFHTKELVFSARVLLIKP